MLEHLSQNWGCTFISNKKVFRSNL